MLEHADRDNPVEAAAQRAVVLEQEAGLVGKLLFVGPRIRDLMLLLREGYAGEVDIGMLCQIETKPAPA
jgi:hypothetical protein